MVTLSMINGILKGILKVITKLLSLFLLPINLLINQLFPDMTTSIQHFNTFVSTYLGSTLSFFFSILPPIFRSTLFIWLTFVIAYYTIYYSYLAIVKIFDLIQKIKFW